MQNKFLMIMASIQQLKSDLETIDSRVQFLTQDEKVLSRKIARYSDDRTQIQKLIGDLSNISQTIKDRIDGISK